MNMRSRLARLLGIRQPARRTASKRRRIILTGACVAALQDCLILDIRKGHEGIAYLLGLTDGTTTLAAAATRPEAVTTCGSFNVSTRAMANVVRAATNLGLQVVGQVHTHPGIAYHSDGDEVGARIRYTGYASIVLPDYGRHLPKLTDAAIYMFDAGEGFVPLNPSDITIAPGRVI